MNFSLSRDNCVSQSDLWVSMINEEQVHYEELGPEEIMRSAKKIVYIS